MISAEQQEQLILLIHSKLSNKELVWLKSKTEVLSNTEKSHKFKTFFSLTVRFISPDIVLWTNDELEILEQVYPGFGRSSWTKQDLARTALMMSLHSGINEPILLSFFEIAEMKEQIALYKGLYFLENASVFSKQVAEGIRTNMSNVFDAIASGNPFAQSYLSEEAWNQMILKSFLMDRTLYQVQYVDRGKNEKLANMLQDYVKERWAAGRQVSLDIWRMIDGYLRDDLKNQISKRTFEGMEAEVISKLLRQNNKPIPIEFWYGVVGRKELKKQQ